MKLNFVMTEVQNNLVELEGLIANQKDNNWSEPNLVTTELGDVLNGIWLGITTGRGIRRKNRSSTVMKLNRLMEWNSKSTVSKIKKGIWSISSKEMPVSFLFVTEVFIHFIFRSEKIECISRLQSEGEGDCFRQL